MVLKVNMNLNEGKQEANIESNLKGRETADINGIVIDAQWN